MDLKVIHDTILFIVNKEQNAYLSHEEIDSMLDRAQITLFNQYHTNPKVPARTQSMLYGENQRIDDALSTFKDKMLFTSSPLTNITSGGLITLPNNYLHLISLYTTNYNAQLARSVYSAVQVLTEEELIERLESQVIPVSYDDPICIMNKQNKIQLFPEVAASGGVFYFRRPIAPVFSYTQSGRVVTYNSNTSTQLEWRDFDVLNIISIALSYIGINISSPEITQFAELKTQQGQ